jgi:hypothetical protein
MDYDVLPEGPLKLEIHDQQGIAVYSFELGRSQQRIDWEPGQNVAAGIFVYRLSNSRQMLTTGKIIKIQ